MKVGALDHPKTKGLKSRLQCSRAQVIGHLELLWAFTAQHAVQGDIGKWGDEEIAEACDWTTIGDRGPEFFVTALIDKGFLDRSKNHRLLVHDWSHHAPRWVHLRLKKEQITFLTDASIDTPIDAPIQASIEPPIEASSSPSLSKGYQASPREEEKTKIAPAGARKEGMNGHGRPKDLLWEAMLGACGIPLTAEIPKPARGAYNKALKDLRDIGATPDSVHAHARAFTRKWKTASLTPTALVRRWNECVVVGGAK